jgi:hypothetical protein
MIRFKRFTFPYEDVSEIPTGRFAPPTIRVRGGRRALLAVLLMVVSGCSARATSGAEQTDAGAIPEECDRYLAQYTKCMTHIGQPPDSVASRAASARESFAQSTDASGLKARCVSDLTQLRAACP